MQFDVGDKVAFSGHGATTVSEIETRCDNGADRQYAVLEFPDLTIRVPADSQELADLDSVVGPGGIDGVLASLATPQPVDISAPWSEQRYAEYMTKLGIPPRAAYDGPLFHDSLKVAEVVRDLAHRQAHRPAGLSIGERRVLWKAQAILARHIAVHRNIPEEDATALIDEALAVGLQPAESQQS